MNIRMFATLLLAVSLVACGPKPEGGETGTTTAPPATAGSETPMASETPAPAGTMSPMAGMTPGGTMSPMAGMAGTGVPFETAAKGLPGYDDVKKMALTLPTTPDAIARGKEIFMGKGTCSSCHGDTGLGNGPAGEALDPKPRNMTDPSAYKWGPDAKGVYRTAYYGGATGSLMVAHGEKAGGDLKDEEVKDVAAYVLSLQKKK